MRALIDHRPFEPCPEPFNMAQAVLAAGQDTPDKIALQILSLTGAERWSFDALTRAVRGIGTGFLNAGLQPGDRLMLRLGNTVEFPLAYLGAIAVGMIPVPTSAQLTQAEVTDMAAQIAPKAIVAADGIALPVCDALRVTQAELAAWHDLPPCEWEVGSPDRPAYMIFTSGTSGKPRAVLHAHRAVWARRMMWQGWYGLTAQDRLLHAGSFNWTYTLGTGLMDPWAAGACALIPADGTPAAQLPLLLKRFDATIFAAAPGVYRQILKSALPTMPRLRHGLSAGESLPETTRRAWTEATQKPVYEALGMSEVSTYVSGSPDAPAPDGATGYAQNGRCIAVLRPDGSIADRGEPGTLAVHRADPGLFLGYYGAPEDTDARFSGEWFLTGDDVSMDEDGAIRFVGRSDDMMNAGGYRVSPIEVERAFLRLPGIVECAAVEVPVKQDASVIALFYSSAEGAIQEDRLQEHAKQNLARYKQPRLFIPCDSLPKGANNKLNRKALRTGWKGYDGNQT